MITSGLICSFIPLIAKSKKIVEAPSLEYQKLSFSAPIVFDKETLKAEALNNPHRNVVRNATKAERKQIRKDFETLVHHKDAKSLSVEALRQAVDFCLQLEWNEKHYSIYKNYYKEQKMLY